MVHSFTLTFIAIFVALDIVGTLPLYIAMTHGLARTKKTQVVNTSMMVALVVALLFILIGQSVFKFLNITLFDFKVAGGLVLLLVSLSDLLSGPEAATRDRASGSTGVVPLAVPLITGPSVITTLIFQVESAGYFITIAALFTNYWLGWLVLQNSDRVTRLIGRDGTVVVSKIAALMMAAIAVVMIRGGVFAAIDAYRLG